MDTLLPLCTLDLTYVAFVIFNLILKGSCWISLSSSVIDAYLGDIFRNTVDGVHTEGLVDAVDSDDFMSRLQSMEEVWNDSVLFLM